MFGSVGWGEILVLLLVALFVFGPDRLPSVVKDAGGILRKVRGTLTGARRQIRDELGDSFPDIDPRMLNPKQFVRRTLLEDLDDANDFDEPPLGGRTNGRSNPRRSGATATKPVTSGGSGAAPAATADAPAAIPSAPSPAATEAAKVEPGAPAAPYDPDTT